MREFRQFQGRGGVRYWQVWFEAPPGQKPATVASAWGMIKDDKRSEHGRTADTPGPKGKRGTKSHVNACDNACFHMDRMVRKKTEEGYVEVGLDGRPLLGGAAEEIDFDKDLPKNLCFSKPRNTVTRKFIMEQDKKRNLLYTRKINGMMVIAQIGPGVVGLYSRRMDDLTPHFPHLVKALLALKLPEKSILLFEAYMGEGNAKRDLLRVQSVMRSKPDRAVKLQKEGEWMSFYLLRIPIWKGSFLEQINTCEQQLILMENTFADLFLDYEDPKVGSFLRPLEVFDGTLEEAEELTKRHGYEGWVVYQKDATMGTQSFSFHGKPDRPKCCFKLKPEFEDDFIAIFDPKQKKGTWGSGKNQGKVGTLSLHQLDANGEMVYVCETGGFTDAQRDDLTLQYNKRKKVTLVATVKYSGRSYISDGDDSNALDFPSYVDQHNDKSMDECINPRLTSPAV